jgi:hypothetical protein
MYKATPKILPLTSKLKSCSPLLDYVKVASSYCRVCIGLHVIFCPVLITIYMKASTCCLGIVHDP